MAYTSLYRLIYFIAKYSGIFDDRNGFFDRKFFLDEFNATREETCRDYDIQGPLSDELKDFLEYKSEHGFWYTVSKFTVAGVRGLVLTWPSSRTPTTWPIQEQIRRCRPLPRCTSSRSSSPKPTHHPQYHFQPSTHYSIKCFQANTPSSFVGLHGDGVRALGKRFDGDLFFQTRKSSTGGHCIWVEPNCPQMLESEEIKKQLENAYALIFECRGTLVLVAACRRWTSF